MATIKDNKIQVFPYLELALGKAFFLYTCEVFASKQAQEDFPCNSKYSLHGLIREPYQTINKMNNNNKFFILIQTYFFLLYNLLLKVFIEIVSLINSSSIVVVFRNKDLLIKKHNIIIYSIYSPIRFPYRSIQTVQLYTVGKIKPFRALR